MARGNWQRRVESAETRRMEAKQRKQKTEDKREHKSWMQEFMRLLDRHDDQLQTISQIHVWTDSLPSDSPPILDLVEDDPKGKQRSRAGSVESEDSVSRKGRGRGNVASEKQGNKKKAHPRSKEAKANDEEETSDAILLCRSHFFSGRCKEKKGSCRCLHYSSQYRTLFQVLSLSKSTGESHLGELTLSEAACKEVALQEPGAMEMVYHFGIKAKRAEGQTLSDRLVEEFSEKEIKMANIVYLALGDMLVYDRNREGVVMTEADLLDSFANKAASSRRKESIGSESDVDSSEILTNIPGTVLEHILTFLPDASVASFSGVCKAWSCEIGQNSPNLWRHLLQRRMWPLPASQPAESHDVSSPSLFRTSFIEHYTAMRDVGAIRSGCATLDGRRGSDNREASVQDFSSRKHAPSHPNSCIGVHVWSPNHLLAGYHTDCSLRLFESVCKSRSEDKLCRELICQKVDPYRNTKKRRCRLVAIGLDEECIGCLCHVMADGIEAEAYILVIVNRDSFLQGQSSDSPDFGGVPDEVNAIDIGEAVLHYFLSSDMVDHRMLQLTDFLSDGGEFGDVEVLVSQNLASCGFGRFMVEVSVSIPVVDPDHGERTWQLLDRKLVLFSVDVGAIVWMGESSPLHHALLPRHAEMTIASLRRPHLGGSRAACSIAVGSSSSLAIMTTEIAPSGEVQRIELYPDPETVELVPDGWTWITSERRPMLVTPTDLATADTIGSAGGGRERRTVVSFYQRYPGVSEVAIERITLDGNLEAFRMASLRDSHVAVLCRSLEVDESDESGDSEVHIVVLHVPSRREICRSFLVSPRHDGEEMIHLCAEYGTVGVGLFCEGVILTGDDVRSLSEGSVVVLEDAQSRSAKKKKKRNQAKGGKKDGFARGMRHGG